MLPDPLSASNSSKYSILLSSKPRATLAPSTLHVYFSNFPVPRVFRKEWDQPEFISFSTFPGKLFEVNFVVVVLILEFWKDQTTPSDNSVGV